jgi:hypothetical protein
MYLTIRSPHATTVIEPLDDGRIMLADLLRTWHLHRIASGRHEWLTDMVKACTFDHEHLRRRGYTDTDDRRQEITVEYDHAANRRHHTDGYPRTI